MERHSETRRLKYALAISLGYFFAELIAGFLTNSLALLSDAGHMLSDIGAIVVSLFAFRMARRPATPESTYGYHRAEILAALFNGLAHQRLLLEYDTERAGSFEPLRFVPKGKIAVLGLITTKTARVESVEELQRRIDDAARYLPLEQLALSPQCGFASSLRGNLLSEDEEFRKLDVMLETARRVWG